MAVYMNYILNKVLIPIFGNNYDYQVSSYFPFSCMTYIKLLEKGSNNVCIFIDITTTTINISQIKMESITQCSLLKHVKKLADELNVPEITLSYLSPELYYGKYEDDSYEFELNIDITMMQILLYGETKFNKNGFYNKNMIEHIANYNHNQKLLQMPIGKLLRIYIKTFNENSRNWLVNPSCFDFECIHKNALYKIKEFVIEHCTFTTANAEEIPDIHTILEIVSVNEFMTAFYKHKLLSGEIDNFIIYVIELINYIELLSYCHEDSDVIEPLLKYDSYLTSTPVYSIEGTLIEIVE